MQILILTFDPPDPPVQGVPGHFCVIALNMVKERFELLDSLRGPFDTDGLRVLHTMATNIQKLWRQSTNSQGHSFNPRSIDHYPYAYVRARKQTNTSVSLFFFCRSLMIYSFFVSIALLFIFFLTVRFFLFVLYLQA